MTNLRSRRGATVRDVRRTNQATLLRRVFFAGPMSRQDLSDETGLSGGTVTNVVNDLIRQGLVVEAGTEESDGGRPRILLQVARDRGLVIGAEVGETRIRVEAFDLGLGKVARVEHAVDGAYREPERVVQLIADGVEESLAIAHADAAAILGIGVGVSGIVDQGPNPLVHSQSLGWEDVPLAAMIRARLDAPVIVDNGAKALGQAEMWLGAGRGSRHAAVALLGTGVGAAIFTDGQLYRGAHSSAGEWGHTSIVVGGRGCRCGSRGCLEAYVGGFAIAERWAAEHAPRGPHDRDQEIAVRELAAGAGRDPAADVLLAQFAEQLGAGLATLINLFNPERVVLQGWLGLVLGPIVLDAIRTQTRAYALARPFSQVEIVLGELGSDAVALGAATLVVDAILAGDLGSPIARPATHRATPRDAKVPA
jgi:predicted NBD/HSP70 family sugar kinase